MNLKRTIRWAAPATTVVMTVLAAQGQKVDPTAPKLPEPVIIDASVRRNIRSYELTIEEAVTRAGAKLAEWADSILGAGGIYLVPAAPPKVSGLLMPDDSVAFDVQLAEMSVTGFNLSRRLAPVEANPKMTAAGAVKADDPVAPAASTDPNQQYANFVREVLIDVLIDGARAWPVSGQQWVTIQVTPIDVVVRNPNYFNPSRRLTLSLRGADLDAFRAGTLTRDQLRERVVDRRF